MNRPVWLLRAVMAILSIGCIVVFVPWAAGCAYLAPLPDTVQDQVDDALKYELDGIIVYVDQAGREPALYAAGWKDRENRVPADPHALFKIASISKLYIAAAAAKLANRKSLSLEDTLADLLPELARRIENSDRITLRMILQHRSGIPNYTDAPEYSWSELRSASESLNLVLDQPADFDPDDRYAYSNTNYLLIGMILDETLGYSHRQYIEREILHPLGLTHTHGLLSEVDSRDVVSGYHSGFDDDLKTLDYVIPGGSMVATAQDVGIFLRALNDGSLFDDDEQGIYSTIYVYDHTGLLPGYSSIARYHQDVDAVVIQFVNTNGGNSWTISEIVYNRIIRILRRQRATRLSG